MNGTEEPCGQELQAGQRGAPGLTHVGATTGADKWNRLGWPRSRPSGVTPVHPSAACSAWPRAGGRPRSRRI